MKTTQINIRIDDKRKEVWATKASKGNMSLSEWIITVCDCVPDEAGDLLPIVEAAIKKKKEQISVNMTPGRRHHPMCKCMMCTSK